MSSRTLSLSSGTIRAGRLLPMRECRKASNHRSGMPPRVGTEARQEPSTQASDRCRNPMRSRKTSLSCPCETEEAEGILRDVGVIWRLLRRRIAMALSVDTGTSPGSNTGTLMMRSLPFCVAVFPVSQRSSVLRPPGGTRTLQLSRSVKMNVANGAEERPPRRQGAALWEVSRALTINWTCFFSALPVPTTPGFTSVGAYSNTGGQRSLREDGDSLAWPSFSAP